MWTNSRTIIFFCIAAVIIAIAVVACGPPANRPTNSTGETDTSAKATMAACTPDVDRKNEEDFRDLFEGETALWNKYNRKVDFYSRRCVLYVRGLVTEFNDFKSIIKIAGNTPGIKRPIFDDLSINAADVPTVPCVSPLVECGDLCVRAGQCNIDMPMVKGGTPTPTPTPTPIPSPTKTP